MLKNVDIFGVNHTKYAICGLHKKNERNFVDIFRVKYHSF